MANAEHLEILKSGVEKWNEWRKENEGVKPDLSNADLHGALLTKANLQNVNMYGVDLSQAFLYNTNMTFADLSDSSLSNAFLNGANLSRANLSGTTLYGADLSHTNLSGVNLSNAELTRATLLYADLSNADLSDANLSEAFLVNSNLSGANLHDAFLSGSNLSGSNLSETIFYGTTLGHTIFGVTDLSTCIGLNTVEVSSLCIIDFPTLRASKNLPKEFLTKLGIPDLLMEYLPDFYSDALNFYPVFLSHSWKNKPFARKLYEALIAKGVNVFFDEKKMKPGDDIYESISKGIGLYDKMILVCSKESLAESWWVDRELDRILKKERDLFKERGQRINLLIPITLDDFVFSWDGAKAEEVRRYVVGDFRDWQDETKFEKALNDLIRALNADRPDVKPKSLL